VSKAAASAATQSSVARQERAGMSFAMCNGGAGDSRTAVRPPGAARMRGAARNRSACRSAALGQASKVPSPRAWSPIWRKLCRRCNRGAVEPRGVRSPWLRAGKIAYAPGPGGEVA
jgi:hypothetical protein